MANQNTNMPHCNWKKKLQINMQTETHQIHKEVPPPKKKHYFKEKISLLFKVHNIITDLMFDLKVFFFSGIHKMYTQTLRTKSNTFDAH